MDGPEVAWMVVMRSSSDRFNRSDFSKALQNAACVGDIRNVRWLPVALGWEDFAGRHEKTFQGYANSCALHVSNVGTLDWKSLILQRNLVGENGTGIAHNIVA